MRHREVEAFGLAEAIAECIAPADKAVALAFDYTEQVAARTADTVLEAA